MRECSVGAVPANSWQIFEQSKSTNIGCTMKRVGRTWMIVPSGFATKVDTRDKCSSLIGHVLNYHLTVMNGDGFIERAWNNSMPHSTMICDDETLDKHVLSYY